MELERAWDLQSGVLGRGQHELSREAVFSSEEIDSVACLRAPRFHGMLTFRIRREQFVRTSIQIEKSEEHGVNDE